MRPLAITVVLALTAATLAAAAPWTDDFSSQRRYETWGPDCWQVAQGRLTCRGTNGNSFLIAPTPRYRQMTAEVELTPEARTAGGWEAAGLALFADASNFWRLLLVVGPQQERYFELVEEFESEHQAQNGGRSARTRLTSETAGTLKTWEYGHRYRVRLELTPERLIGTVTDPADGQQWQRSFDLTTGRAVTAGRGALTAMGLKAALDNLQIEGTPPAAAAALPLEQGRRGTVALIPDEEQRLTPRLAAMLRNEGYGVTVLPWDQLDRPLPWDKLDLLMLADARRVPLGARDLVVEAAHSAGKVVCLGAPAFQTLLAKSPEGWLPQDRWLQSYANSLPRRAIGLPAESFRRNTSSPESPSSLSADPAGGPTALRITTELQKGWDTYQAPAKGAFDEEHQFLILDARGDQTTTQMSIEATEEDGSRWIAVIDLKPDWQTYVLPPSSFVYWEDSRSKGRGGAGDRLRPEKVASLTFGLASSHTLKVRPGPHTYEIRNVSAGDAQGVKEPDFSVPDLETISPSYKLYPLPQVSRVWAGGEVQTLAPFEAPFSGAGYAPVWREQGRGLHRQRPWRWVPLLHAEDAAGRERGALLSMLIGDRVHPDAVFANLSVAEPAQALSPAVEPKLAECLSRLTRGCFLLEGGAELFSYRPGEAAVVGGRVTNTTRQPKDLTLLVRIRDGRKNACFEQKKLLRVSPGEPAEASWQWRPDFKVPGGYSLETWLLDGNFVIDGIIHRVEATRTAPARPEEFVRVQGSNFTLGGKPWFFKGINYYPNRIGGISNLGVWQRSAYDPEVIERDLTQLKALGLNALSAVHAVIPGNPDDPKEYRDQLDFLDRCDRHGFKVFFFMPDGRPYQGGDAQKMERYIEQAGIKRHPAIMCWELAWEPIESNWEGRLDYIIPLWNRWIVQRYGSVESACRDWGFTPQPDEQGRVPLPTGPQTTTRGEWDRFVAAFRRAHSDLISAGYRDIVRPLRAWDPDHLISFRGGACGIPYGPNFAHIHSAGAPKHMDFLNPEGYNLQTQGIGTLTPPDDIRRGGLVTRYYRFTSREKPIVWMEFGYTVNGFHTSWTPELVHISPDQLQKQKTELQQFYDMILESGARGAAPWWWPGGFRLGENSDFGLVEPDGALRPACDVMRQAYPRFAQVVHRPPTSYLDLELETHYADSWPLYSDLYLQQVKAGKLPAVRTAGTGTDSRTCPLTAVGGGEYNGHNPPLYLNAEFNALELKVGAGPWTAVQDGQTVSAPVGAKVLCRANAGNLGEAGWLAPGAGAQEGRVYLAGRQEYGLAFEAPLAADTPYLKDGAVREFVLVPAVRQGEQVVSFEMMSKGRAYFGERRTVTLRGGG